MVDQLRFFAGAARCMEGRAAGEYMEGHTSFIRREPLRRLRPDHALELPADDGRLEDRPGAGDRQHAGAEAGRDDPGHDAQDPGRDVRRDLPARRLQLHRRARRARRLDAGHPPRGRLRLADGLARDRQVDRQGGRGHAQAGAPGAGRQGPGDRLRRRRHGDGDGDDRRHRLLQRRPGLHRGDARARIEGRLRRRRLRPRRAGEGLQDR